MNPHGAPLQMLDEDDQPLASTARAFRYHENRPLIDQVHNAWLTEKDRGHSSDSDDEYDEHELIHCCDLDSDDSCISGVAAICRTRRFRRSMLLLFAIILSVYFVYEYHLKPGWDRERILEQGFNNQEGTSGLEDPFKFKGIIQTQDLQTEYRPGGDLDPEGKRRLIFVGDIHGCKDELLDLLRKVKFDKNMDHLICTGDVVSKGPDSLGVVDTLIALNASSVRGNHEDKVLIGGDRTAATADLDKDARKSQAAGLKGDDLAPFFRKHHLVWLQSLPLILNIPALMPPTIAAPAPSASHIEDPDLEEESKKHKKDKKKKGKKKLKHIPNVLTDIHVVHGGLVPGLPLRRQDPFAIMNMRSMSPSSHVPSRERDKGVPWERIWGWYNDRLNKRRNPKTFSWFAEDYQDVSADAVSDQEPIWRSWLDHIFGSDSALSKLKDERPSVVIYGHDSPRGLNLHTWSKGLDSGCIHGRQLTALVLNAWGQAHLVQTKCKQNR